MVIFYTYWIQNGKMKLEDVPEKWKIQVKAKMGL